MTFWLKENKSYIYSLLTKGTLSFSRKVLGWSEVPLVFWVKIKGTFFISPILLCDISGKFLQYLSFGFILIQTEVICNLVIMTRWNHGYLKSWMSTRYCLTLSCCPSQKYDYSEDDNDLILSIFKTFASKLSTILSLVSTGA